MTESKLNWYAVKGLFRWFLKETGETLNFEERVVIFESMSFEESFECASKESEAYCEPDPTANFLIEPTGWWNSYLIAKDALQDGTEVYSRLMDTSLATEAFIRRYYPRSQDHKFR